MINLDKIQEQLNNGWYVSAEDIQAMIDYIRNNKRKGNEQRN